MSGDNVYMDHTCMMHCVWDTNIYQFLYENHALAAEFCLLSVAILNLRIILTHRVKDILDHFSSLSVQVLAAFSILYRTSFVY